ncbi:transmembrane protein 132E isoform X1 [Anopheles funestus]|uniref:transmembrane protein 132E isoform X1 n=1 Tax=Anopheles funestus TaxID=62324 RepID=UPI0020C7367D|nr:transmembrane protein 132E isoform X1 [Anopheles funestus]XP_049277566.1 transmembrane protein 132E isoform X1 [Anopheles funestus]XP_049277567.1 transmembrane protein 132E isoform X1 [Anopheles funestus]XP_049277568.1 transmembrane protein 132E isoform X1 [Anopheles funestus]XP_049277569.1 transmembrane protein 132E isoform X1 [Anopheles funestus]XP_049277570.1 transmembrane protein 132E isoform X1 [Anopheles funestus]XP_049277572.1 transmembrane protein 132E isoform X1 [Anopheles funestu
MNKRHNMGRKRISLISLIGILSLTFAVEVHFETPDSGFFLKHSPRQSALASVVSGATSSAGKVRSTNGDSLLSVDRFTVVQTSQPVSVRASYGPFSTKQTVPARYIVPDVIESTNSDGNTPQNTTVALMDLQQQANLHLDISAHVVRSTVARDSPVLRVLFHAGADPGGHLQRQKICVLLHASMGNRIPLKGRCMPEGEDGVCVAEVVIPSNWWPALPPPERDGRVSSTPPKSPQRLVQVSYSVFEPPARSPELCEPKVQIQPLTSFAKIPLTQSQLPYKELRADNTLTMMVPQIPLYPLSKIHVPVFLHPENGQNIAVFIVRARVKAGMRILGAVASSDEWNVSVEKENTKHTVARVTAFRKDQDPDSPTGGVRFDDVSTNDGVVEVFSWLLEVSNDTKEYWDGGRIIWSVSYVHDGPKMKLDLSTESSLISSTGLQEEGRKKIVAKLEIQKDDIQAVLPIAKNWELMNTAVLTGRQVSQAMKVFIVSQAGKMADVTLQSSCQTEDESVIKVSSSCSSVYIDGSEVRGSSNASILVKYGTYSGLARFTVWMPEFPLEVSVADFRLSQIKGWKIPEDHSTANGKPNRRKKRAYGNGGAWGHHNDDFNNGVSPERGVCRARYQQSPVEVYARFVAVDQDSGRVSYLISRRTGLRVTDLVQSLLRVADPKIASLRGRTLQGRAMGRTDVQVLSPINGRVIGAREVRVGSDKVTITRLTVKVVSGLQLSISGDGSIDNGYIAETSVTRRLTAQYQEGLLDIELEFSDGSRTPLRDISVDDYFLLVESLDTEVVAFAPMLASHHPRVIAVGEGNGELLRVTLLLSEECRIRRNMPVSKQGMKTSVGPLVSALASVQVDFSESDTNTRSDTLQNDGAVGRDRNKMGKDLNDLEDILIGIPLQDDNGHETAAVVHSSRQHHRGSVGGGIISSNSGMVGVFSSNKSMVHGDASTLEIGMYIVLTAFCLAIVVFVVSCVVYASKYRPVMIDANGDASVRDGMGHSTVFDVGKGNESCATNAHDWVWLGRATVDRSNADGLEMGVNQKDSRMHIISNPMNSKYDDMSEHVVQINSFDNPNHIQLPSTVAVPFQNNRAGLGTNEKSVAPINSCTYKTRDRHTATINDEASLLPQRSMATTVVDRIEYRPPVPPHRNIGVTAQVSNKQMPIDTVPQLKASKRYHHRPPRNSGGIVLSNVGSSCSRTNPAFDIQLQNVSGLQQRNINHTQQQLNLALFNNGNANHAKQYESVQPMPTRRTNRSPHSFENMGFSVMSLSIAENFQNGEKNQQQHRPPKELHMAERLVEQPNDQQTAFKFDTINQHQKYHQPFACPKSSIPSVETTMNPGDRRSAIYSQKLQQQRTNEPFEKTLDGVCKVGKPQHIDEEDCQKSVSLSSDDDGGFIPTVEQTCRKNNVNMENTTPAFVASMMAATKKANKKPTVVGNPMFSTTPDSELGPGESLGLDDLDMDYEQIMHYFDNLKESNA